MTVLTGKAAEDFERKANENLTAIATDVDILKLMSQMETILAKSNINSHNATPPFRLGRKQQRAVLDANGLEVMLFPNNFEIMAQMYCDYLNRETKPKISAAEYFEQKFGNKITANDSWVIRFAEEYNNL